MNGGGLDLLGSFSPEEREYILKMLPNLTGMEEEAGHQQALANALRRPEQNKRMDWGSQASRAISGIGSGLAAQRAQETRGKVGAGYKTFAEKLAEIAAQRRRPGQIAEAPYSYEDLWSTS